MSEHLKQNAAKSVGAVFILSLVASLLSFVCEMFFAQYFGVSAETDAFTIASQIPVILFSVVTVSISTTVVPMYSRLLYSGEKEASQQFASKFMTLTAGASILFVAVCEVLAPVIVKLFSPGVQEQTFVYAVRFIRISFPTIVFTGLMSVCMGILQVHKRFGRSSVLTVVRQCIYALCLVALHRQLGIYAAVGGLLVAAVIECFVALVFTVSEVSVKPNFRLKDASISQAIRMSGPICVGIGAAEINRLVDKIVASFLESGSISMLNYASKLSGAFTSLLTSAISTVMFPYFAERAGRKDKAGLSEIFFLTLKAYLILTIPVIAGGVILRQELVGVAFLLGAFTKNDAVAVAGLFGGYLFSMIFSAIRQTGAKLFYAMGDTKTPMGNTLIGVGLNIVLNVVLGYFMGAMGLVLATVISTAVISLLLMVAARNNIDTSMWKGFFMVLLKTVICALGMAVTLIVVMPLMAGWDQVITVILAVITGMLVYGILLLLLGKKEIKEILTVIKNN